MPGKFSSAGLICLSALALLATSVASDAEWEPEIYPDSQIFPSLIIGTAAVKPGSDVFAVWEGNHIGDKQGSIGASVDDVAEGSTVALEVR